MRGVKAWVKALLALLLGVAANSGAQSLLIQAEQAHARYDLAAEMKLLEAAAGSASDEDRAEAERRLAWLAWRFYKDDQAARKHFEKAESIDFGLAETLAARAAMETARGRFEEARRFARRAFDHAGKTRERDDARIAFAAATVEEAFAAGKSAAAREALDLIAQTVRSEPVRSLPIDVWSGRTARRQRAGSRRPAVVPLGRRSPAALSRGRTGGRSR